jgi:hypothetical protein
VADTIVNTPTSVPSESRDSGLGFFLGILLLLVVAFLVIYYGFGGLFRGFTGGGTTIEVPRSVDVNVNTPNQ